MPDPQTTVHVIKGAGATPMTADELATAPAHLRPLLELTQFVLGDITLTITNHTTPPQEH
jgi:hypothetical protein